MKGPATGALVIVGGGRVGPDILTRFFNLAGGRDATLVVIPTAETALTSIPMIGRACGCSRNSA